MTASEKSEEARLQENVKIARLRKAMADLPSVRHFLFIIVMCWVAALTVAVVSIGLAMVH
jgi:hypothetical protein